ncbi:MULTISPECIES: hypothetical protein [unclassified Pseudoclavibacter]|uniref:hypothetical protein n=1 Tax=unclassified Pseudoclavibacter TaxID=2615177 RepID=UPI001BA8F0CE|nr:hypothetical protein [Pseudoclavibacter sp. Marseille-Q4354]MBS3177195.1 hypothetical protein [Pseudoclavibacter sp. Marseille-Q4354]
MSARTFHVLNEVTLAATVLAILAAVVCAFMGQTNGALIVAAGVSLLVGAGAVAANGSLEKYRPACESAVTR